jgi:tetraacyldisaccharide 4'-kinase
MIGPTRVDPSLHTARQVGDEPLMLSSDGLVFICRDRPEGARAAARTGVTCVVMDDGHQNPTLHKDLSIVVVDAASGIGNGAVFPAGPLREKVADSLKRAHAVIVIHPKPVDPETTWTDADNRPDWIRSCLLPVLDAWLEPRSAPPEGPIVAFAGLARPDKFFGSLRSAGADVRDLVPFPDHHPYSAKDMEALGNVASAHEARLVTTEKDAARLTEAQRFQVHVFGVDIKFADPAALASVLQPVAERARILGEDLRQGPSVTLSVEAETV